LVVIENNQGFVPFACFSPYLNIESNILRLLISFNASKGGGRNSPSPKRRRAGMRFTGVCLPGVGGCDSVSLIFFHISIIDTLIHLVSFYISRVQLI